MAERNPPRFMDVVDVYSGDELGFDLRHILAEGIVATGDLAVTAGAGNSIDVAAGHCYVLGDTDPDFQPLYGMFNDAVVNKGISPDATNPRRVRVIAQIIDEGFAGEGRKWEIQALHGTPAITPVLPAEPASAISLANILVPAGAASSAAYTITDLRTVYALAAALGGVSGDMVKLFDTTLGGAAASIDIQSIPATYGHLLLVIYGRSALAAATDTLDIRLNNDSGANYDWATERLDQTGFSAGLAVVADTKLRAARDMPGATAPANSFGAVDILLPHYAGAANHKIARAEGGCVVGTAAADIRHSLARGRWRSAVAVNRITIFASGGNLVAGTRATLYGLKAAA